MTKIRIVTHSGGFHADDVFGVAALRLLLAGQEIEVLRSRDPEIIRSGDYVLDAGFVYDESKNRFDHHQEGGAGKRNNGIPYASFGLIWKKFGKEIIGSQTDADAVDEYIIEPIDAYDNGVELFFKNDQYKKSPFLIQSVIAFLEPARGEALTRDEAFMEAVAIAGRILERVIVHVKSDAETKQFIHTQYEASKNKTIIVFPEGEIISRTLIANVLGEYQEPIYFVRTHEDGTWQVVGVSIEPFSFAVRKSLPVAWQGKKGDELASITGVTDAFFCHRAGFMAVTKTKEGAIALAELALTN
ncbi:MAG: MYG1 family protein [Candidatus Campbellbacteria bacterium]|nr:MYG1 family protein [Candidatus Campbellbacteria bacterium]